MKLTFKDLLADYEQQLAYIKRMIEPETLSFYGKTLDYWEGYFWGVFRTFEEIKIYTDFNPHIRKATTKEEKEFLYLGQPPCGVLDYRGLKIPIYDDDPGQQFFMVFEGEEFGGGAFNGYPEEDFCYLIDESIDYKFALGGTKNDKK